MIKEYTHVSYSKRKLRVRGIDENGERVSETVEFSPTIWVDKTFNYRKWKNTLKSEDQHRFKTLFDKPVIGLTFNTIADCEEFLNENAPFGRGSKTPKGVLTAPNNKYESQFLCEKFDLDISPHLDKMRILFWDIETETGHRIVPDSAIVKIRKVKQEGLTGSSMDFVETEVSIDDFESMPNQKQYELFDKDSGLWVPYSSHPYRFIGGFPEPDKATEKITLITVKDINARRIYTWSLYDFKTDRKDIVIKKFDNESGLLADFLSWFSLDYPDIFVGFNSEKFDNLYLATRVRNVLGEEYVKKLSPYGKIIVSEHKNALSQKSELSCEYDGIACLDYLKLYKKWGPGGQRESYKLDSIGEDEVGVKKVPNPTGGTFREFYTGIFDVTEHPSEDADEILKLGYVRTQLKTIIETKPEYMEKYKKVNEITIKKCQQRFVEYNIRDVELIELIEKKLKLLNICTAVAYKAHENFADAFSPVKTWDYVIYNHLWRQNVVIPEESHAEKSAKFEGAFVKNIFGKFKYVASFDLDSLYPHIIMEHNISPETIARLPNGEAIKVKYDMQKLINKTEDTSFAHSHNFSIPPTGVCFKRDKQGIIPYLCETFYSQRKAHKKEMLKYKAEHEKIVEELRKRGVNL